MTVELSVLLLIDLSAAIAGGTRDWQEYWKVGQCYLPQIVYEEIQFLCNRAPEPSQEQTAREFMRFYFGSGWHLATTKATHPTLTPASGQAISKRARLGLATAECAYGLAQENGDKLVVFVANNHQLLQKIQAIGASNLCAITSTALLQWSRTGQRPPAVTQQMQSAIKAVESQGVPQKQSVASTSAQSAVTRSRPAPTSAQSAVTRSRPASSQSLSASSPRPMTGPASAARMTQASSRQKTSSAGSPSKLISSVLTLLGIAIASLFVWRTIQPASFNRFSQQLGLPQLAGEPAAKPQKPVKK